MADSSAETLMWNTSSRPASGVRRATIIISSPAESIRSGETQGAGLLSGGETHHVVKAGARQTAFGPAAVQAACKNPAGRPVDDFHPAHTALRQPHQALLQGIPKLAGVGGFFPEGLCLKVKLVSISPISRSMRALAVWAMTNSCRALNWSVTTAFISRAVHTPRRIPAASSAMTAT